MRSSEELIAVLETLNELKDLPLEKASKVIREKIKTAEDELKEQKVCPICYGNLVACSDRNKPNYVPYQDTQVVESYEQYYWCKDCGTTYEKKTI